METTELQHRAPSRPHRVVLVIALALALAATAGLASVGSREATTQLANRAENDSGIASRENLGDDDGDSDAPLAATTTTVPLTTTTVPHTTTTVAPFQPDDSVGEVPGNFDDPHGSPVVTDPKIIQFKLPRAKSYPQFLTTGPDGAIWFAEENTRTIGRITTAGEITEYQLSDPFRTPVDIVVGPDNALWFNDANAPVLGRITVDGHVTVFETGHNAYFAMVAGPDGALWYTTYDVEGSGAIARVTTTGEVTHYPVAVRPRALVVGPDGHIWATDIINGILRIATDGTVQRFTPLQDEGYVYSLVFGPQGTLWFTYATTGETPEAGVGMMTTGGSFSFTPIENFGGDRLVYDGHKSLWINSGNEIVRLGLEGDMNRFAVKRPMDLLLGPDGNIWFANDLGAAIGRIDLGG